VMLREFTRRDWIVGATKVFYPVHDNGVKPGRVERRGAEGLSAEPRLLSPKERWNCERRLQRCSMRSFTYFHVPKSPDAACVSLRLRDLGRADRCKWTWVERRSAVLTSGRNRSIAKVGRPLLMIGN
jgi:hypothetical protein